MITDRSVSSSSSLFFIFFPIFFPIFPFRSRRVLPSLPSSLSFFFFYARKTRGTFVIMIIRKRRFPGVCIHRRRNNRAENSIEYVYIYIYNISIHLYIYIDLCITRYIIISLICGKRSSLIVYGAHWRIVLFFIIFFFSSINKLQIYSQCYVTRMV